jgi:hypothetical protein
MRPHPSPFAVGLLYAGGIAWIYALVVVISIVTDTRFEIPNDGGGSGIPLPNTWFYAALFTAIGGVLWRSGRWWDRPGFTALRARRPWLVPVVFTLVVFPAIVMFIFVLVR